MPARSALPRPIYPPHPLRVCRRGDDEDGARRGTSRPRCSRMNIRRRSTCGRRRGRGPALRLPPFYGDNDAQMFKKYWRGCAFLAPYWDPISDGRTPPPPRRRPAALRRPTSLRPAAPHQSGEAVRGSPTSGWTRRRRSRTSGSPQGGDKKLSAPPAAVASAEAPPTWPTTTSPATCVRQGPRSTRSHGPRQADPRVRPARRRRPPPAESLKSFSCFRSSSAASSPSSSTARSAPARLTRWRRSC